MTAVNPKYLDYMRRLSNTSYGEVDSEEFTALDLYRYEGNGHIPFEHLERLTELYRCPVYVFLCEQPTLWGFADFLYTLHLTPVLYVLHAIMVRYFTLEIADFHYPMLFLFLLNRYLEFCS